MSNLHKAAQMPVIPTTDYYYSRYQFALITHDVSSTIIIHGLRECLTSHHGIINNIVSNQGTHFITKEMWH